MVRVARELMQRALVATPQPVRNRIYDFLGAREVRALGRRPGPPAASVRLLVGPMNTAGQGYRWARAADHHHPDTTALAFTAQKSARRRNFEFRDDLQISLMAQRQDLTPHRDRVLNETTHVLAESFRAVLGDFWHRTILDDLPALADHGIAVAVVLHGSEARDPALHRSLYPTSPFDDLDDPYIRGLRATVERTHELLQRFPGPVFVSTPDLLDFVPGATWLPLVIDVDAFASTEPAFQREAPVVLHAPSNPRLKGTAAVEPVLERLHAEGRVVYRRLEGIPHAKMPEAIRAADVVVDQVVLGNPGVLLAETLAAGRVAVAHVAPQVRARMDPGLPVVEATAETFDAVMAEILANRDRFARVAAAGPAVARRNHDGRRAAAALSPFLAGTA